jgi:hypothetical protein
MLSNETFDNQTSGYGLYGLGTQSWAIHNCACAYEGSNYLSFNCGAKAGCSVYQDKPWSVTSSDVWTNEVALHCQGAAGCTVHLTLWGIGITAREGVSRTISLPNDAYGVWHIVVLRVETPNTHNDIRWEVGEQDANTTLAVDFATLHWTDYFCDNMSACPSP